MGSEPVRVGILETGFPPPPLAERFGSYADMVATMLGEGFVSTSFDVTRDRYPAETDRYDGFVITGSPAGVYDPLPWIAPLERFLRQVRGRAKLVGICFGHQIMAQAFGGMVRRSEKGYAQGLHTYSLAAAEPWMDDGQAITIAVSHQDQVIEPPADARIVGGSPFTPNGILAYGTDGFSFQCHPSLPPSSRRR